MKAWDFKSVRPSLAFLVTPVLLGSMGLTVQSIAQSAANSSEPQRATQSQKESVAHAASMSPEATTAEMRATQNASWPANQPPNPARVSWDSRGLEIDASNSSLDQILRQVAAETGAKLHGITQDQRIFGTFGPGPGCDVLSKLLEGSGYNVLMTGSRDDGAPLEIVLSTRSAGSTPMVLHTQNQSRAEHDAKEPTPEPPPERASGQPSAPASQDPYANGAPPRDPMEFMQEILQRQQVIDQQQQQQQQHQ